MSWGDPVRNGLSVGIGTLASLTSSSGIGGIRRPTMSLNFLLMSSSSLDSRITFSRGTNATLTDSTGRITYAPANLLTFSEQFDNAAWTKTASTVTANTAVAPDGTTTADTLAETAATSGHVVSGSATVTTATHVFSVYLKKGSGATAPNWVQLYTGGISSQYASFNLGTGTVGNVAGGSTATITNVGNGWYRCTLSFTPSSSGSLTTAIAFTNNTDTTTRGPSYAGATTSDVFAWGAQLEPVTYQTTPSTYVATTSAAYYGPRFDYDPVTLAARGLLIEEQRTNLLTYSEQFDNAAWSKDRVNVSSNVTLAPDGTTTADKVTDTAAGSNSYRIFNSLTLSAISYTQTFYAKAAEYSWCYVRIGSAARAWFNLAAGTVGTVDAGLTASMVPVGNGWYRITCTIATATAGAGFGLIGLTTGNNVETYTPTTGGMGIFIWGAQLEAGAFATSYIPTVASTVTRNADSASMTGTNFSSWYNQAGGTFVLNADSTTTSGVDFPLTASDGTGSNRFGIYRSSASIAGYIVTGGATVMEIITTNAATANIPFRAAAAGTLNDGNVSFNGNIGTTDTSITMPTVNQLGIGNNAGGGFYSGHIRSIAYYNTRLSNSQLQTLTAPSLASTLSLDFINGAYNVGF